MRRVFAALLGAALLAAACAGSDTGSPSTTLPSTTAAPSVTTVDETTTTTQVPPPEYGGSVTIGEDQEPVTLNPFAEGGDDPVVSVVGQAHLAGVYDIDGETLDLTPELVTELPSVGNGGVVINDDGTLTVRYRIRDEAVWSDGVPITGYDLDFTLGVMREQSPDEDDLVHNVISTEAEAKSFEMVLAEPTVAYETMFPVVIPKHAVEGTNVATAWTDKMWPSAGPFIVAEWEHGDYLRLVRNPEYWKTDPSSGAQLPYLDEVVFKFNQEHEALLSAFVAKELDVLVPSPDPDTVSRLRNLEPDGVVVQVKPGPLWEHLNFQFGPANRNDDSLNQYSSYRQAIAYAIDTERMASLVSWEPITSILSPGEGDGPWQQYGHDPDKAVQLLEQACTEAGRDCAADPPRLVFSTTSNAWERPTIADELVDELSRVGITVELQLEDSQLFFGETLDDGTWDVGLWAWVASPDAAGFLSALEFFNPDSAPPEGRNYYRWGTPDSSVDNDTVAQFRGILATASETVDPEQVISLARVGEEVLADSAVLIPIAARPMVGVVWANEIGGFELNTSMAGYTWNIELWHRFAE
jgi:peptide/nickel transport system substrate-binding protein